MLETIKDQGLELQVIFNKGAVMILPAGVNKASGLAAALGRMRLSPHNAVAIGDAENDHALLSLCECGVAVANALATLKDEAAFVTSGARGAGVIELIDGLLADDLASHEPQLTRHHILLGRSCDDREVRIRPYGENVLLAGPPAGERPRLVGGLLEGLSAAGYSFCVIEAQANHEHPCAVSLGAGDRAPSVEEVVRLFQGPDQSGIVTLMALPHPQRLAFLNTLMPRLAQIRRRTGRPHWVVVDGDFAWAAPEEPATPATFASMLRISDHPRLVAPSALAAVNLLIATGNTPQVMFEEFCRVTGVSMPPVNPGNLGPGEALAWRAQASGSAPFKLRIGP